MTLIAGHDRYNYPVLFGDVLLTRPRDADEEPFTIPGFGKAEEAQAGMLEWYAPAGLVQKVILLSPSLAFAWTGSPLIAEQLIALLTESETKTKTSDFTREDWIDYLAPVWEMLGEEAKTKIGADFGCILFVYSSKYWALLPFKLPIIEAENCSVMCVGGSGAEWAKDAILKHDANALPPEIRAASPYEKIICVFASFWARDSRDQLNYINSTFGGGYEAVIIGQNGLQKLDDFLLANVQMVQTSEEEYETRFSMTFAKFDYLGDYLAIRVLQLSLAPGIEDINLQVGDGTLQHYLVGRPGTSCTTLPAEVDFSLLPDMNGTHLGIHADCILLNGEWVGLQIACSSEDRLLPISVRNDFWKVTPELQQALHDGFKLVVARESYG